MSFSLIAAIGRNREIGQNNQLIFRLREDMALFRQLTLGHPVIMGRKTWESMGGRALPGRLNLVLSRHSLQLPEGVEQIRDLASFVDKHQYSSDEIFVIGGAAVYAYFLPFAAKLYLTELEAECPTADAFFPKFSASAYTKQIVASGQGCSLTLESAPSSVGPSLDSQTIDFKLIKYTRKGLTMSKTQDPVFQLIKQEELRQSDGLELIPSENYVSAAVLRAAGSVLTNKYSEGYPSFEGICDWPEEQVASEELGNYRYYGGQTNIDRIERLAISRACKLFHADHANVQPHSGANANEAVYFAWCEPGDKILAMSLAAGGHLTHGAPVTRAARTYQFLSYGVTEDGDLDYVELERIALSEKPKIILVGYSAFMKIPDFARVKKIADQIPGCLLMADMAHVAGLIAGGVHPNPLDYGFHVMTTTTHKTLRGPRGGLILSKGKVTSPLKRPEKILENIPTLIDRAVFPGTQGGPLEHIIAAKAVAFGEALQSEFKLYTKNIIKNAKALAKYLKQADFVLQGDGTENHLILINMRASFGIDGKFFERALDQIGLNLNANAIASDAGGAFRPSGVRLGTPAITTRGLGEPEMRQIATWIRRVADICVGLGDESKLPDASAELAKLRAEVKALAQTFPVPGI